MRRLRRTRGPIPEQEATPPVRPIAPSGTVEVPDGDADVLVAKAVAREQRTRDFLTEAQRENRALRRQAVRGEDFLAALSGIVASSATPVAPFAPPAPDLRTLPDGTAVLSLSDLHNGLVLTREASNGLASFDGAILRQRLELLCTEVVALLREFRVNHRVDQLLVLGLGDWIEHRYMHEGQVHDTFGLALQVRGVAEAVASCLFVPLAREVRLLRMLNVPGNHDRGAGPKGQSEHADSYAVLVPHLLGLHCQIAGARNVEIRECANWFEVFQLYGHDMIAFHGDQPRPGGGGPAPISALKTRAKMESMTHRKFRGSFHSHLHNVGMMTDGFCTSITNGSLPGASKFTLGLGLNGCPSQTLCLVTAKTPIARHCPIQLATREEVLTLEPEDLTLSA